MLTGVELARKEDLGVVESVTGATPDSPQEREKALRREFLRLALGDGPVHSMPLWAWRLGEALLVAVGNEPYSVFQQELRRRFPGTPVFVLMTTNGGVGYLPRGRPTARAATRNSSRRTRPGAWSSRSRRREPCSKRCVAELAAPSPRRHRERWRQSTRARELVALSHMRILAYVKL